ncbi:hypothetical protein RRG08_047444 [Elysia crispata]|uniref:Uncharacterized protein n=1 Tax=Elysia crispata TaxID=231223 RepID=A0AAE0YU27_9GAST|nr:hypothetical protein RRG08_047444 [Elysia crispata]
MSHTERKAVEGDAITRDPSETTNRFKNTVQRQPITIFQNPAAQHPLSVCPRVRYHQVCVVITQGHTSHLSSTMPIRQVGLATISIVIRAVLQGSNLNPQLVLGLRSGRLKAC